MDKLFFVMKKINVSTLVCALGVLLAGVSCSPQALPISLEMRHPSRSGLDLMRKTFAVVYVEDGNAGDSLFSEKMAVSFATRLENEYFDGKQTVGIFKIPYGSGDYASKDSLVNLALDSGEDVVFLFDKTSFGPYTLTKTVASPAGFPADSAYRTTVNVPISIRLLAYDTMNKEDKVFSFSGSNVLKPTVFNDGSLTESDLPEAMWPYVGEYASGLGNVAGASFMPVWKEETFQVLYYESFNETWINAAWAARECKWDEAITKWMTLLKTKNMQKRSCAEYNIALGCFMMGQKELALKWLDQSDKDYPISLSKSLRKRISQQ